MLTIHLESDILYLHGAPEDSAGTEIRGCLELRLKETTRVKSISLQFMGLLKQNWAEASQRRHGKFKKHIYQRDWTFLPERNWPHIIKANTTYRYPFDLVLPGHMAESIASDASGGLGSLAYEFKASVIRPFATKNMVVHRPTQVIRIQPSSLMDNGSYYGIGDGDSSRIISKTFGDKINYRIKLDTDQYQRGQPIRIHFTFEPLLHGLHIEHISCFLKEYTTLTQFTDANFTRVDPATQTPLQQQQQQQQSRIISLARDDRFPCHGTIWEDTETVVVPRSAHSVQLDVDHPWMRIEHKLRLTVRFAQPCGQNSELRVTIPIKVLEPPACLSSTATTTSPAWHEHSATQLYLDDLPRYEEACLIAPYNPQHRFWSSSTPSSPTPSLPSLLSYYDTPSPSYNDGDGDHWQRLQLTTTPSDVPSPSYAPTCDYFSYQPVNHLTQLERAPSYSTIIRS